MDVNDMPPGVQGRSLPEEISDDDENGHQSVYATDYHLPAKKRPDSYPRKTPKGTWEKY
ncbi:hypothetical protein HOLleu_00736 [Holothuria leucospilota]|uniref:Uncharacterized protein n=1 Tax=Holothuria leucospilota TaxID=206669 RepID=A0A9Q1CNF3_HOLLE|nr:hypothetical protein HOLleu_00736 [Holothuria leucospilota]